MKWKAWPRVKKAAASSVELVKIDENTGFITPSSPDI